MKAIYTKGDQRIDIKTRSLGLGRGERVYMKRVAIIDGQYEVWWERKDFATTREAWAWIDRFGQWLAEDLGWTNKPTKTEQRIMDRIERRGRRPKARRVAA